MRPLRITLRIASRDGMKIRVAMVRSILRNVFCSR